MAGLFYKFESHYFSNGTKYIIINILQGERIQSLGKTVEEYITNYAVDGSSVGIVLFSDTASTVARMTEIKQQSDRTALFRAVPTSAGGGTSIGAGLQLCQQVSISKQLLRITLYRAGII